MFQGYIRAFTHVKNASVESRFKGKSIKILWHFTQCKENSEG